ncbi:hypothetical protein KV697_05945 [Sphingomonas sanguinis]|uniref:hypothetical protein n=1 Tax=Sphingomonas sanguinis TaxID=33051 RepID=UPI001C58E940|nr:hypothetical protein [Sphingomonas sanguinis]QXT36841.1 hypothetical protein KV697_05945 [Sphingomonas sanguinis]
MTASTIMQRRAIYERTADRSGEAFQLVNANVSAGQVKVAGGDYVFAQTGATYGTVTLQVLGPDGNTWLTLVTKSASDAGSGTGVTLAANAVLRVTVAGTIGCYASLSRVPA